MNKIQLVIEIDERYYEILKHEVMVKHWDFLPCTLIANGTPLPKGHGRLIDADSFVRRVQDERKHSCYVKSWTADDVLDYLNPKSTLSPTIIEADKEGEDE